jgi:hypothetical protein
VIVGKDIIGKDLMYYKEREALNEGSGEIFDLTKSCSSACDPKNALHG